MGKNFRGEPGKVEKAVLKSLELKILVLNHHVPVNFSFIHTVCLLTTRVLLELSVNIIPSWMGWPCLSYHVKVAGGSATASQVKLEVPEIKP